MNRLSWETNCVGTYVKWRISSAFFISSTARWFLRLRRPKKTEALRRENDLTRPSGDHWVVVVGGIKREPCGSSFRQFQQPDVPISVGAITFECDSFSIG